MSRQRNEELDAEIERIADLKLQIPQAKALAQKHHRTVGTIRQLISAAVKRKRTFVMFHAEQSQANIATPEATDSTHAPEARLIAEDDLAEHRQAPD